MTQSINTERVEDALSRHERAALQLSGGRDSVAALYALRPYWGRFAVYTLDTGERFPETAAVIEAVEKDMGITVIRVQGDVAGVREHFGYASDILPVNSHTELGRMRCGSDIKVIDRHECCWHTTMAPMHERMAQDGITLIIRGQRNSEYVTTPIRSGFTDGVNEVLYPIEDWSNDDVMDFIRRCDLPVTPFYATGMNTTPNCMGCTAWWDEGRIEYIKENYPDTHAIVMGRIREIKIHIDRHYKTLPDIE